MGRGVEDWGFGLGLGVRVGVGVSVGVGLGVRVRCASCRLRRKETIEKDSSVSRRTCASTCVELRLGLGLGRAC